jgi:O-antigen/teichoic acid export membrane protein
MNWNESFSKSENYKIFKKMQYVSMSVGLMTTVCLYVLTEPFIKLWVGSEMLLGKSVLVILFLD